MKIDLKGWWGHIRQKSELTMSWLMFLLSVLVAVVLLISVAIVWTTSQFDGVVWGNATKIAVVALALQAISYLIWHIFDGGDK